MHSFYWQRLLDHESSSAFDTVTSIKVPVPCRPDEQWPTPAPSTQHTITSAPLSLPLKMSRTAELSRPEGDDCSQPMSPMAVDEHDSKESSESPDHERDGDGGSPVEIFHKKFDKLRKHTIAENKAMEEDSSPEESRVNTLILKTFYFQMHVKIYFINNQLFSNACKHLLHQ